MDGFRIIFESRETVRLLDSVANESKTKIFQILNVVTRNIKQDAQNIIKDEGHIWTSRLINSVQNRVYSNGDNIIGEVYSGTDYDIYIHEGTKKHFVNFIDSSGMERMDLVKWAIDHGIIKREGNKLVNTITGAPIRGITVGIKATKFMERPYQQHIAQFVAALARVGAGDV